MELKPWNFPSNFYRKFHRDLTVEFPVETPQRQNRETFCGISTESFGSELNLNGLQTGPPHEISKRTPPDPIRTPTDSASDFKFNNRTCYGSDKSVPEHWTSPLDFKMKVCAGRVIDFIFSLISSSSGSSSSSR